MSKRQNEKRERETWNNTSLGHVTYILPTYILQFPCGNKTVLPNKNISLAPWLVIIRPGRLSAILLGPIGLLAGILQMVLGRPHEIGPVAWPPYWPRPCFTAGQIRASSATS